MMLSIQSEKNLSTPVLLITTGLGNYEENINPTFETENDLLLGKIIWLTKVKYTLLDLTK